MKTFKEFNSLTQDQVDEILGFGLAKKAAKGVGKLAFKGAKKGATAAAKFAIKKGKEKFTAKGRADALTKKAKKLADKRKTRERIEKAKENIRKEKEALKKKKESMPPNTFKRMRMALKKKVQGVNDAEAKLKAA